MRLKQSNLWPRLAAFVLPALAAVFWTDVLAQTQASSPEQCTCAIAQSPLSGAVVSNAASCFQRRQGNWCDIYIPTLENTAAHADLVGKLSATITESDPSRLAGQLLGILENRQTLAKRRNEPLPETYDRDAGLIKDRTYHNYRTLRLCLEAFTLGRDIDRKGNNDVFCFVGAQSHWLRIEYPIEARSYVFLIAPNTPRH